MIYSSSQQAFDQVDQQRTNAVLAHLHQLLAARKAELLQKIDQAANSEVIPKILASPGNAYIVQLKCQVDSASVAAALSRSMNGSV
ncbi:MAG: hypothetical protein EXQ58_06875 [Acidobacteria bacterium]|nr:hypothetical protein [Acidobacteriota bacterium]